MTLSLILDLIVMTTFNHLIDYNFYLQVIIIFHRFEIIISYLTFYKGRSYFLKLYRQSYFSQLLFYNFFIVLLGRIIFKSQKI